MAHKTLSEMASPSFFSESCFASFCNLSFTRQSYFLFLFHSPPTRFSNTDNFTKLLFTESVFFSGLSGSSQNLKLCLLLNFSSFITSLYKAYVIYLEQLSNLSTSLFMNSSIFLHSLYHMRRHNSLWYTRSCLI